jgi:O-acetyl-ADP-ribose deacetylase (regulator of RNase III)
LVQADVLVNSTSTDLHFNQGPVEKAILRAAGPKLADYCNKTYKDGIKVNGIAMTDSFNMKNATRLYHVALAREPFPVSTTLLFCFFLREIRWVIEENC